MKIPHIVAVADAFDAGRGRRLRLTPAGLVRLVVEARTLGISGSRAPDPGSLAALADLAGLAPDAPLIVGDQRGIDAAAAGHWPHAQVERRADDTPRALVARSIQMLDRLGAEARPLLAAFPARPCPARVAPGPRWCSGQPPSGTWSTLALAVGRGLPAAVWLPEPLLPPLEWKLRYLGGGWWMSTR